MADPASRRVTIRARVPALVVLSLALSACGARTGLTDEFTDADRDLGADARVEASLADAPGVSDARAPIDSGLRPCPLTPPAATATCDMSATALECVYAPPDPSDGLESWSCISGAWFESTTVADQTFTSCSDVVCAPGVFVECVVGSGASCCVCSYDMTVDQCAPC
jgi:hypothetical protein